MLVVFTDLDGTLLDSETNQFDRALPSLERLRKLDARLVLVSSKTQKEVEFWRQELKDGDPFSVENGGAVLAARGSLLLPESAKQTPDGYEMVEFGIPYRDLVRALREAANDSACRVRGFADMSAQEISICCKVGIEQARMAMIRNYDEPFQLLEGDPQALRASVERRGFRLTQGGRFFHITGGSDKADAVRLLVQAYRHIGRVQTIGVGDGLNDAGFLNLMDYPVILDSPLGSELRKCVPRARTFPPGPAGWNTAILEILALEGPS
jgi:mannosyl-3-phosphoglycerate phosphatase